MIWRVFISALAIVALTLVSLGHRPPDPTVQAQATAYLLTGGSFADLCADGGGLSDAHAQSCQACILSATCALPDPAGDAIRLTLPTTIAWHAHPSITGTNHAPGAALARAPPFG